MKRSVWCARRRRSLRLYSFALVLFALAHSQDGLDLSSFLTTDASVAGHLQFTLESGAGVYTLQETQGVGLAPDAGLALGYDNKFEFGVAGSFDKTPGLNRWSYTETAGWLKYMVRDGSLQTGLAADGLSLAIELGFSVPREVPKNVGLALALSATHWSDYSVVHVNVTPLAVDGFESYGVGLGMAVEGPTTWLMRPVAEVYLEVIESETVAHYLAGIIYPENPNLWFDLAIRKVEDELQAMVGINWSFPDQ